jgi:hypothetical protein
MRNGVGNLVHAIAHSNAYQQACLRTENTDQVAVEARLCEPRVMHLLMFKLREFVALSKDIDAIKKYVFYGKEPANDFPAAPTLLPEEVKAYTFEVININFKRQIHAVLGVTTESAELCELIEKTVHSGEDLTKEWRKEWGDIGWYQCLGADACDTDMGVINGLNILKLKLRYPEKFTEEQARKHDGQ